MEKGIISTFTDDAGAHSVGVVTVFLAMWPGPVPLPPLMDRFISRLACRSCWTVPTRWHSSVTWELQTLLRAFGWAWSYGARKARMTALLGDAATSPAALTTACWSVPVESPIVASMVHTWWRTAADNYEKQSAAAGKQIYFFGLLQTTVLSCVFKFLLLIFSSSLRGLGRCCNHYLTVNFQFYKNGQKEKKHFRKSTCNSPQNLTWKFQKWKS